MCMFVWGRGGGARNVGMFPTNPFLKRNLPYQVDMCYYFSYPQEGMRHVTF